MKTVISNDGGYEVQVEIQNIAAIPGHRHLHFTSTQSHAKNPLEQRTLLSICLNESSYQLLKQAINGNE